MLSGEPAKRRDPEPQATPESILSPDPARSGAAPDRATSGAACPHCGTVLSPVPPRRRLCPACRQPIVVRIRDGRPVLFTPEGDSAFLAREHAALLEQERVGRVERAEADVAWFAHYYRIPRHRAEAVILGAGQRSWAPLLGGGHDGGRAAASFGLGFAAIACARGNHEEEARLAEAVAREVETDEAPTYGIAWASLARASGHLLDEAATERRHERAERLLHAAMDGIADTIRRHGPAEVRRSRVLRAEVDGLATALERAEEVLGLPPSDPVADKRRRQRTQSLRAEINADEGTFFLKHRDGLLAIWRRDSKDWWHRHYVGIYGTEPPDGWWAENPGTATGGQIAPGLKRAFGGLDRAVMDVYFR